MNRKQKALLWGLMALCIAATLPMFVIVEDGIVLRAMLFFAGWICSIVYSILRQLEGGAK